MFRGRSALVHRCLRRFLSKNVLKAGVAQLVERQPSKLNVAGSSLVSRSTGYQPM